MMKQLPSLSHIVNAYKEAVVFPLSPYFNMTKDTRVDEWLLMTSPLPTLALTALYLLIVWLGPKYMNTRPAFSLRTPIVLYNFLLVLLSAYMCYEFFVTTFLNPDFNIWCQVVDTSDSESSLRLAKVCWWYYFSKCIEFWDTFFFILRKKNNQVSFLHVYHHSTMFVLWWVGVRYIPGGCSFFSGMLNSGVHVLMYTYYMLSAIGPHMRKYLWWKKYMTIIQLTQFWLILGHTITAIYLNCGFPTGIGAALIAYMVSHILLFSNFYNKAYQATSKTIEALTPRGQTKSVTSIRNGTHSKTD